MDKRYIFINKRTGVQYIETEEGYQNAKKAKILNRFDIHEIPKIQIREPEKVIVEKIIEPVIDQEHTVKKPSKKKKTNG